MAVGGERRQQAERREHEIEAVGGGCAPEVGPQREGDDTPLEQVRRDEVEDELRRECRQEDRRVAPPRRSGRREVEDERRADAEPARGDREAEPVGGHPPAEDVGQPAEDHRPTDGERQHPDGEDEPHDDEDRLGRDRDEAGELDLDAGRDGVGRDRAHERDERERAVGRQQQRSEGDRHEPGREQADQARAFEVPGFALALELENRVVGGARGGCGEGLAHPPKIGTPAGRA